MIVRISRLLDRHRWMVLGLVLAAAAMAAVRRDRSNPFVHDEIYTVLIAGLPSVRAIWTAERSGADLTPPLNTLVTHAIDRMAGAGRVVSRIPPLAGYLVMSGVLFELVRRRAGPLVGLTAAVMPFFTAAFAFALEARGYGLMLGLYAIALFAWMEAAGGRGRRWALPALAIALGLSIWNHYYALLGLLPIAMGELVRMVDRRKFDAGIAAACAAALLSLIPLLPLVRVASSQAGTYWRRAHVGDIGSAYVFLLEPLMTRRGLAIAGVTAVALVVSAVRGGTPARRRLPAHEVVAIATTVAIPLVAVLVGVLATGVFVPRYALIGAVGISLAIPLLVWRADRRSPAGEVALCLAFTASFLQLTAGAALGAPLFVRSVFDGRPLLLSALADGRPVVVAGPLYLESWYYAAPAQRARLVYLADPVASKALTGSDTLERGYLALRRVVPLDVEEYGTYLASHPAFTAYVEGEFGWLPAKLKADGAAVHEVGREGEAVVYDVGSRWTSAPGHATETTP